ncbi:MAG: amidase [Alphaproteobacteria bacterium]|jgi:aspartyl-tRNA(Asn)/glutamyl-tRNA(Gln) amidotransferase subunit A|nr:amidase [Alphaproteobacteria bacterium]
MSDIHELGIAEIGECLRRGDVGVVELTKAMLGRITALDGELNSFITVTDELALAQAEQAERELRAGTDRGPLHGIPIALKDLIETKGIRTTFASRAYADHVPEQDATVVRRLADAGAVLLGKTNLSEGAADSSSQSSAFGGPCNPWNTDYITGGSSGGSAAAVAAHLAFAALGSDTGMSIRQPAALCGIVGLKPTFGRVSKAGAMTLSDSFDHLGPMTRNVRDAALVLQVLAGHDPNDPCSADIPVPDFSAELNDATSVIQGARLAIPRDDFFTETDPEWIQATEQAITVVQGLGAEVAEIKLPGLQDLIQLGNLIVVTEAAAYHRQRFQADPDKFGPQLTRVISIGEGHGGADYVLAQQQRRQAKAAFLKAIEGFDAMVLPTTTLAACPITEDAYPLVRPRSRNTLPFNALGWPAISLPCGLAANGMPMGLQIVGRPFAEGWVLALALAYEQATEWHLQGPNI